jgi:Tfp pilus assembly protein PilX
MNLHAKQQRGMVLITSLIMLVIMTMLAISLLRTSVIELKIGGASQVTAQNLANAEATIWTFLNAPNNRGKFFHGATMDTNLNDDYSFSNPNYKHMANVALTATEIACTDDAGVGRGNQLGKNTLKAVFFDVQAQSRDTIFAGLSVVHQGIRSTVPPSGCQN